MSMRNRPAAAFLAAIVTLSGGAVNGQPPEPKVPSDINAQFANPDVKSFVDRFEGESREVSAKRAEIVKSLGLRPGMAVADVGAGTGLFTRPIAEEVGPTGKVYAVDISEKFLAHIAAESKRLKQPQVEVVLGGQTDAKLPTGSVDLIYLCDVYHHVEKPGPWLASLRKALKPKGRLVLVEFDREAAPEGDFVKKHVRAGKATFIDEFKAAGFEPVETPQAPALKQNFIQAFRASDEAPQ